MEENTERLAKAMEELTAEIRKLRAQLMETPNTNLEPPEFGWDGLGLEATEVLADSKERISSREITKAINGRRGALGYHERTQTASVARALTALASRGLVTRMRAGRKVHYSLNPGGVSVAVGVSDDPRRAIEEAFEMIRSLPESEKESTKAVWYSLHGPEEAAQIMKQKTDLLDTKAVCELFGMPRPPRGEIRLGGVQGISLKPSETRLYVFLLR